MSGPIRESSGKVGLYVDVANIARNGGYGMRFDILRDFACREHGEPLRLNAYVAYDADRAKTDIEYKRRTLNFYSALRDLGYKVIEKVVSWYVDDDGNRFGKANADLDMAVDALLQSENLDRVMLATGDGDFIEVVRALQNKGCRVEAMAFQNVSSKLKREVDLFMSGYLIPNLQPIEGHDAEKKPWGTMGSRVRGICYTYNSQKNFGFIRFLKHIGPGLWITDTRRDDSPYGTAFAHESSFEAGTDFFHLPSRDHIFEFDLTKGDKGLQASNIVSVYPPHKGASSASS
ncbi:MAG: NYN domain-containing protein, partial [Proteobacteria bacterium]|nr:NYN domain-containing protein [Pseudomonadota bacterium]